MRPRIGITTSIRPEGGSWQVTAASNLTYSRAVYAAGGLPLLLPNLPPEAAEETLGTLDGLLLSGGGDIDPAIWGEARLNEAGTPTPERDEFEMALVRAALARAVPLLGICRGVQVLAVATGGDLWQDIPTQVPGALPHRQTQLRADASHEVIITPGTLLARILVPDGATSQPRLAVNSFHHQAPRNPGTIFAIAARSPDGLIEGLEAVGARFALGVQWHPEEMAATDPLQARLFAALIEAATGTHV